MGILKILRLKISNFQVSRNLRNGLNTENFVVCRASVYIYSRFLYNKYAVSVYILFLT